MRPLVGRSSGPCAPKPDRPYFYGRGATNGTPLAAEPVNPLYLYRAGPIPPPSPEPQPTVNAALTPSQIVQELDKYIIGQHSAKKSVAIALRNRWRRLNAPNDMRQEIMPNNILMIGATGVGKTEIARRLAQLADAPFIKVEASKFTEVGYVGRDVESMVRDLVEQSVNLVKAAHKAQCREKATALAEDIILDILIPPVHSGNPDRESRRRSALLPPSIDNISDAEPDTDAELNQRTREKFRDKLRRGDLDGRKIEIEVNATSSIQVMGPPGMENMEGLQEMLGQMIPKKRKKRTMTIAEAREYLIEDEAQKLIDMDTVTREAIDKAENSGIIFIDEIDKIASGNKGGSGPDVSREGVQRDLLPIVEGSTVNTKYGAVRTDHVLFIAAGAFHVSKPSDLIPELQGRFPIRVELSPLTKDDFVRILTHPRNALTKQYQAMLAAEGVGLQFTPDAIDAIAELAFEVNNQIENIGARRLHTVVSNLMEEFMFAIPDSLSDGTITIQKQDVEQKLNHITRKKDLSHYIL